MSDVQTIVKKSNNKIAELNAELHDLESQIILTHGNTISNNGQGEFCYFFFFHFFDHFLRSEPWSFWTDKIFLDFFWYLRLKGDSSEQILLFKEPHAWTSNYNQMQQFYIYKQNSRFVRQTQPDATQFPLLFMLFEYSNYTFNLFFCVWLKKQRYAIVQVKISVFASRLFLFLVLQKKIIWE